MGEVHQDQEISIGVTQREGSEKELWQDGELRLSDDPHELKISQEAEESEKD
jgi:hypothetical protein